MSGDSPKDQGTLFQQGDGGSNPTSPLQVSAKQLLVLPIGRWTARRIWLDKHYLHRDVPGISLELGVFSPNMILLGAIGFSEFVVWARPGGNPETWELRRLWLDDVCGKNSESRVISISLRMIKKLAPHVRKIIAYADPQAGHKGTIYRATGFHYRGLTKINEGNPYGSQKEVSRTSKHKYVAFLY